MEELNSELKSQINKRFEDLFKEIGNNRQQLAAKVLEVHRELNKELSREKVDEQRKGRILAEVSKIERIAAQQLPHILRKPVAASPATAPVKVAKKAAKKAPVKAAKPEKPVKTSAKSPAKKAAPKAKAAPKKK